MKIEVNGKEVEAGPIKAMEFGTPVDIDAPLFPPGTKFRAGDKTYTVARMFRVPPWLIDPEVRRPIWPVRVWYWLRGYRP